MATAKKRQDGEVNQKLKEREREANSHAESSFVSSDYDISTSLDFHEKINEEQINSKNNRGYDDFSETSSSTKSCSVRKEKEEEENSDSEEEIGSLPLPPDRPLSETSVENDDLESEKNRQRFKSLIYGVYKARNERNATSVPGEYTSQFSMCQAANLIPGDGLSQLNSGLSNGINNLNGSNCGMGLRTSVGNPISTMYGSNSPMVGPISMDSFFGGCSSMMQNGLVGDTEM